MALFNRNTRKSTNAVNHPVIFGAVNFFSSLVSRKKYSDVYFWLIVSRIFRGLQNVAFYTDPALVEPKKQMKLDSGLLRFVNTNLNTMVWSLWQDGVLVINKNVSGKWEIVPFDKLRFDGRREVQGYRYVLYSEPYMYLGKGDISVIRENLTAIDVYKNSDIYLTKTFGAFGILSGKDMGINAADKEELQQQLKEHAGTTEAKDQFLFTNSPLDFHQIDFKIKELELSDKVKDEVKALCGYFGVPYDLIPLSGQSTYANQAAAIVDFYRNCVTPLAEQILSLLRYVVLVDKEYRDIVSRAVTFRIDNVAELADDRTAAVNYRLKVAELAAKMRELGMDIPEYIVKDLTEE